MTTLSNSGRQLLKATYAPIAVDAPADKLSQAHVKAALVRGLQLQSGEVDAVRATVQSGGESPIPDSVWSTLKQFEPQPVAALTPKASVLADLPPTQLQAFAQATVGYRTAQLRNLTTAPAPVPPSSASPTAPNPLPENPTPGPSSPVVGRPQMSRLTIPSRQSGVSRVAASILPSETSNAIAPLATQQAVAASMVTFAKGALDTFTKAINVSPIGMLNLERIEMEPAGIERGELVATIPLAPGETTSVTQKEWSVTRQDFSSIVTDYLENYSEKGVTEKSELADSTENESKHSQQLGLSASLSGSYGFVTFATSATANISDSVDTTTKQSRKDAKEVTSKASSRSKKERQVTIQTSSTVGSSETSTRTLTNPSTTNTMRIDYFSMMRKWQVRLLQYGLRLTYDLAIPEPGATLREQHAQLANLNNLIAGTFAFTLDPSSITDQSYLTLAAQWGIAIQAPPSPTYQSVFSLSLQSSQNGAITQTLEVNVPDGYEVAGLMVGGRASTYDGDTHTRVVFEPGQVSFHTAALGSGNEKNSAPYALDAYDGDASGNSGVYEADLNEYHGMSGSLGVSLIHSYVTSGSIYARVSAIRTEAVFGAWQQQAWQTLHDAARDAYYTQVQGWTQQRDTLKTQIEGVDTLTLRREEQEEIMKGILRWLLGPDFDFMPGDVVALFTGPVGQSFTGNELGLNPDGWTTMFIYQEMVKFIQQAIEWENMLYMVYPYFWDVPTAWDFVRTLEHSDPTRQAFLRAGSARVVLTIRSGFEDAFTAFVDRGELGQVLPPDHPYLTIGQEIQAYDQTNYPGIPPANPDQQPRPLLTPLQRKAWKDIQAIMSLLRAYNTKNNAYPSTAEGLGSLTTFAAAQNPPVTVPATDPWGNPYYYRSPGQYNDYELASWGADGVPGGDSDNADITSWADSSLIAEWYEYTPSHGLDISISSAPTDLA